MADATPEGEKPKPEPFSPFDGIGCFALIVVLLVCSAAGSMFSSGESDGWKLGATVALTLFGFGVIWVCARSKS